MAWLACVSVAATLSFAAIPGFARITVTDDVQEQVSVERPARRIIAIAPNLAELAYAAGAGKWLVAVVRGADYPPEVLSLPSVGDAAGLDFERIRRLEPDLILAWGSGNKRADLDRLRAVAIPTLILEPHTLDDVARDMRVIGQLAGTEAIAGQAAARFEARLQQLRKRHAGAEVLNVAVEIWHQPVFTVSDAHPLSDALRVCGARNAIGDFPLLAGPVPLEDVLAAKPDVILSVSGIQEADMRSQWRRYQSVSGQQAVALISMPPELLTRPGPRMLDGVDQLCARLDSVREAVLQPR
ncbi:MAG: cobalamin-binding protein [Burkholderiales bacterium]|jgi:iron complex transport system substrate-binding protein